MKKMHARQFNWASKSKLSSGAFGTVYSVQNNSGQRYALKFGNIEQELKMLE
jgi:serine/threonine protein kinase